MSPTNKSLLDQVREIKRLLDDADETLSQARWAMTTLEFRLNQLEPGGEESAAAED
jgi:hypothetical protein